MPKPTKTTKNIHEERAKMHPLERLGTARIQQALYGTQSTGLKWNPEDRKALLRAGAMDLINGKRAVRKQREKEKASAKSKKES